MSDQKPAAPDTAAPTTPNYNPEDAMALAKQVTELLDAARQKHGPSMVLDVIINVLAGTSLASGADPEDVVNALVTVMKAQLEHAERMAAAAQASPKG